MFCPFPVSVGRARWVSDYILYWPDCDGWAEVGGSLNWPVGFGIVEYYYSKCGRPNRLLLIN